MQISIMIDEKGNIMNPVDNVVDVVYQTTDYDKFKKLHCNRIVTEKRKQLLIKSFSDGEIKNPIIVNEKFEIIDGQGRYEAKKELGLPIQYMIDSGKDINDCRRMNAYNSKWGLNDYITSNAEGGNENHIRLLKTCEKMKVNVSKVLRASGKYNKGATIEWKGNPAFDEFEFSEEDAENACNVLQKAQEIVDALCFTGETNASYLSSVRIIVNTKGYNHKIMLNHCRVLRGNYSQMSRLEDQLKEFSRIYNHRLKGPKLFFEDYMRNKGKNVRDYSKHKEETNISTLV